MKNETFHYTYSAKEQEEIKAIRAKYTPSPEEDAMARLRHLDAGVTEKATVVSLVLGVLGALILGSGMSLVMTGLGDLLGLVPGVAMAVGIAIGLVGIALVCAAYPAYTRTVKRERAKIAPEILRLTDELMK